MSPERNELEPSVRNLFMVSVSVDAESIIKGEAL